MAVILQFPFCEEREYRALSPTERAFVERLLEVAPDYRHERSGSNLEPAPAPGLASALTAAKIMRACQIWRGRLNGNGTGNTCGELAGHLRSAGGLNLYFAASTVSERQSLK